MRLFRDAMGDEPILQFCSDFEDIDPAIEKKGSSAITAAKAALSFTLFYNSATSLREDELAYYPELAKYALTKK